MAICVLLGFLTYMRPRELTGLTVGQLVQPINVQSKPFGCWTILLFPERLLQRSKAGRFDENIPLDDACYLWMSSFFKVLIDQRDNADRLWPFSHSDLIKEFKEAAK
eukprot:3781442-Karenia_brevis.AAC.1